MASWFAATKRHSSDNATHRQRNPRHPAARERAEPRTRRAMPQIGRRRLELAIVKLPVEPHLRTRLSRATRPPHAPRTTTAVTAGSRLAVSWVTGTPARSSSATSPASPTTNARRRRARSAAAAAQPLERISLSAAAIPMRANCPRRRRPVSQSFASSDSSAASVRGPPYLGPVARAREGRVVAHEKHALAARCPRPDRVMRWSVRVIHRSFVGGSESSAASGCEAPRLAPPH
jgi:hypothetical protein